MTFCSHCGWRRVIVKQRCRCCYEYLRRHGTDRPAVLVVRHVDRLNARYSN